ncbi:unnamed protein product, partial [Prorocentrum cordatum]
EEEEEEESQGGAFHSRAVSRRGGGWVRLRCAAGRSARGARGPLGAPLRAPVGSCEPGLALAEDGEGEQERQEVGMRTAQPDQEQVDARTLLGAALAQQNDARGHWARAALLHGNH